MLHSDVPMPSRWDELRILVAASSRQALKREMQLATRGVKRPRKLGTEQHSSGPSQTTKHQRGGEYEAFFDAPVDHGDPPAKTSMFAEPRYSKELFAKWPPPAGLRKSFVKEVQNSLNGARMTTGSPTMEQLRAWNYNCYEHYVIFAAYASP
ncbi:hypothetical protein WJX84_008717 [Apatococcus fuscideae]|uniref:Uncharacterized protein n=1 Tax=Apatococcus fuscideae TaxID=2026836 RepID=A0AAW1RNX3_9CHLO